MNNRQESGLDRVSVEKLIVLCGPTASGKSALAMEVSRRLSGALVSCDSMQLYRGMDIGTAKPTACDTASVPHYMIDVLAPSQNCSAAAYREMCKPVIDRLTSENVQPVLCGGTGLYINALTKPLGFSIEGDPAVRAELEGLAQEPNGKRKLHQVLEAVDPASAVRLHENDVRRVIRAIEVYRLTGRTLTEQMKQDEGRPADYQARLFALDWPRDVLYDRIERRVDRMIEQGLVGEVEKLLSQGIDRSTTAMQAIGYKEIAQALCGEIPLCQAIDDIKQSTRNYAKRQLTWFKRDERVHWIEAMGKSLEQMTGEVIRETTEAEGSR